ncbi:hypothetical protein CF336_g4734, partial [Tilletia laevis]
HQINQSSLPSASRLRESRCTDARGMLQTAGSRASDQNLNPLLTRRNPHDAHPRAGSRRTTR